MAQNNPTPAPATTEAPLPSKGGSYVIEDGALVAVSQPAAPAPAVATYPTAKE